MEKVVDGWVTGMAVVLVVLVDGERREGSVNP